MSKDSRSQKQVPDGAPRDQPDKTVGFDLSAGGSDMASTSKPKTRFDPNSDETEDMVETEQAQSGLDPALQAKIGEQLRAVYDDVAQEPVPQQFLDLLEQLARKEKDQ